jgi:WD40 repeat protein
MRRCTFSRTVLVAAGLATVLSFADARGQKEPVLGVKAVAFSPDGKLLAAAMGQPEEAGCVTVWDMATQKLLWEHRDKVGIPAVAFAPDGQTIAIGGYSHAAKLLDIADGKEKKTLPHPAEVRGVAFSPDGKLLATACWDGLVRVWDVATGTEKVKTNGPPERLYDVQFSPNGKMLLSTGHRNEAMLWDPASGMPINKLKSTGRVNLQRTAVFTPDGRWLLIGDYAGTVGVWDLESGEKRARFGNMASPNGLAFSAETETMAVLGFSKHIQLFDLRLRAPTAKELEHIRQLMARLDDDSYDVREATSKELVKMGLLADTELRRAAKEAASAEVRIRSRRILQEMLDNSKATLRGHTDEVECVAFAPGGKLLASGAKDGTIRLWDTGTCKEVGRLGAK